MYAYDFFRSPPSEDTYHMKAISQKVKKGSAAAATDDTEALP
jgi:hypothetical protein